MKERQTVPFIAGLILVPVGTIVAIAAIVAAMLILRSTRGTSADPIGVVAFVWFYLLEYGCLATAPITLVILPLSYFMLRRKSALAVRKFVFVGLVSAILESCMFVFWWLTSNGRVEGLAALMVLVIVITGLSVGFAFAHLTRLVRPEDWGLQPESIPSGA
jgi:uncharacterized membrane protein